MSRAVDLRDLYLMVAKDNARYMQRNPHLVTAETAHEMVGAVRCAYVMKRATPIRMSAEQAELFLDAPIDHQQDFLTWLRLPFPSVLLTFSRPLVEHAPPGATVPLIPGGPTMDHYYEMGPERHIMAISLIELGPDVIASGDWRLGPYTWPINDAPGFRRTDCARLFATTFHYRTKHHLAVDYYMQLLGVSHHNRLLARLPDKGEKIQRQHAVAWTVHLANFLNSPTVKLRQETVSPQLQKARQRRGKPPLPGWYEIALRKEVRDYTKNKITTTSFTHRFRYAVRGHFKHFRRGRMAGRVVWVPQHERGLANELFRPKGYRLSNDR